MASRRRTEPEPKQTRRRPATTPEGQENQLVSLAYDAVEKRIRDGNASAQELVHFLKLGSTRERLEQERLQRENLLLAAKVEAMASASRIEELYKGAIDAMRSYSGQPPLEMVEDEYDD